MESQVKLLPSFVRAGNNYGTIVEEVLVYFQGREISILKTLQYVVYLFFLKGSFLSIRGKVHGKFIIEVSCPEKKNHLNDEKREFVRDAGRMDLLVKLSLEEKDPVCNIYRLEMAQYRVNQSYTQKIHYENREEEE